MDKGQILSDYRQAKNHKRQIPILADLNLCDTNKIIEILEEGGYKRIFNTNGVDISVKKEEIEKKYADGTTIADLATMYHISKKQIKALLRVEETEGKESMDGKDSFARMAHLTEENEKLKKALEEYECENKKLRNKVEDMENQIVALKHECGKDGDIHEKYQQVCIRNSQLNAAVDVLAERISMLKAVGCHG